MSHVLKCDYDAIKHFLASLEGDHGNNCLFEIFGVYNLCWLLVLFCCHSEFARHECFMPFVLEGKFHCYRKLTLNHCK